jgi:hypothetical protein
LRVEVVGRELQGLLQTRDRFIITTQHGENDA